MSDFSDSQVAIQISSGPTYQPISLWVHEFQPVNEESLVLPQIKTDGDGTIRSDFTHRYAPPFALLPTATGRVLREKCREHVELIAKGPRGEGELYYKDTSVVSWDIFNVIDQYRKSTNVRTLTRMTPRNFEINQGTEWTCAKGVSTLRNALFHDPSSGLYGRLS